jgi:WD repeat-containing protein 68
MKRRVRFYLYIVQYFIDIHPGPVHSLDWCKTSAPGQQLRPRSAFRLGVASFTENYQNQIAVVGLQDERVLVEDDYTDYPDFVTLCEAYHGYPATSLQWQPASAHSHSWSQKSASTELLATTGDALRVWEYSGDGSVTSSNYVGRQPSVSSGHSLTMKTALSGVSVILFSFACVNFHLAVKSAKPICRSTIDELFMEREVSEFDRDRVY